MNGIYTVTMAQAERIMRKQFTQNGIENWKITMINESVFQFEKITEYVKTIGLCECYFKFNSNEIYDFNIVEMVIERYK